jgi:thiol-disulfide isomerase/thioredoxin
MHIVPPPCLMKPIRFPPAVFALSLLLTAPVLRATDDFSPAPAPAWQLKDVNGQDVSFDQFKGKVVVLDFWATWCAPCRSEIPGYIALQEKYAGAGLVMVGVSLDREGPGVVKKFVIDQKINYPIVLGDEQIAGAFGGVEAIPTTFIIDRQGIVRYRKVGAMPAGEFEAVVASFLK